MFHDVEQAPVLLGRLAEKVPWVTCAEQLQLRQPAGGAGVAAKFHPPHQLWAKQFSFWSVQVAWKGADQI